MPLARLGYDAWIDANPELVAEAEGLFSGEPDQCERCDGNGEIEVDCDCPSCDGWHDCPECEGEPGREDKRDRWLKEQYQAQCERDDERLARFTTPPPALP